MSADASKLDGMLPPRTFWADDICGSLALRCEPGGIGGAVLGIDASGVGDALTMVAVMPIRLGPDIAAPDPEHSRVIRESVAGVFGLIRSDAALFEAVADRFPRLFHRGGEQPGLLVIDGSDGFFVTEVRLAAGRADDLCSWCDIRPSEDYLELIAAVAGHIDRKFIVSHGWPILSSVQRPAEDAEAGQESILPGGGPHPGRGESA